MTAGHDHRDVNVGVVARAAVVSVVVLSVVAAGSWWLFRGLERREARLSPPASPLAGTYGRSTPPEPRLLAAPRQTLAALHAEENARLEHYGWVDREAGVVRIPIERAMELLVERAGGGS